MSFIRVQLIDSLRATRQKEQADRVNNRVKPHLRHTLCRPLIHSPDCLESQQLRPLDACSEARRAQCLSLPAHHEVDHIEAVRALVDFQDQQPAD